MEQSHGFLNTMNADHQKTYHKKNIILSFQQYLDLFLGEPRRHTRSAAEYLHDVFTYFGVEKNKSDDLAPEARLGLFDKVFSRSGLIIGGQWVQSEIFKNLQKFVRSAHTSKMIVLHGPNGSAKSSTLEVIARGMEDYSQIEEGCVYRFNWIFPTDKESSPTSHSDSQAIGFSRKALEDNPFKSFALLEDHKIAAKLTSEYKENPIFLIPMPYRETLLREAISKKEKIRPEDVALSPHLLESGLSKKNQQIFENLLNTYGGDLAQTLRYIQVERFFFSKQYRVGISTVEPQMSIDAYEKQVTLDKNYSNLPAILQTISFHQIQGELVEANRGILEFSDLLKRPVESFKYLLNTVEKSTINLPSGTANLDVVFFATTNEKHLDAFKTAPDFSSFKGRFEFITAPYLLSSDLEAKIYAHDLDVIKKAKPVSPQCLEMLSLWAVMTRLKQPDPEQYEKDYRPLVARLDPRSKVLLYEKKSLQPQFTVEEQNSISEIRKSLWEESRGMVVYEGRFGASPREVRAILYKASQNPDYEELIPLAIFEELKALNKNRSIYDFLQFEPRGKYHDTHFFVETVIEEFSAIFERNVMQAMAIADEGEYSHLLKRYIDHVVAEIKKEKLWDDATNSYIVPSQAIMESVEKILGVKIPKEQHRASLLNRIAASKIENPQKDILINNVFNDYLENIKQHFYSEKRVQIEHIYTVMLGLAQNESATFRADDIAFAKETYNRLEKQFGYSFYAAFKCLQFVCRNKKKPA